MDHLQLARASLDKVSAGHPPTAQVNALRAQAHALIQLAENLNGIDGTLLVIEGHLSTLAGVAVANCAVLPADNENR